ncbi:MAG TPA: zf-HC2 domain-containing protein [Gemmataceae bacterium]|nr:zf-HC2 domain-containing protein [Gemmataceae bacterium]
MDCKTARLLLDFHRPRSGELPPEEAAELERHLGACPECDASARAERRLDDHFGRAVREVPLPDRLRERLLARLKEQRGAALRSKLAWTARGVAVAAALLLGVFLWWHYVGSKPPRLDPWGLIDKDFAKYDSPSPEKVENWFLTHHKIAMVAPRQFLYAHLVDFDLTTFEGKPVPKLVFQRDEGVFIRARVYVLTGDQFDLSAIRAALTDAAADLESVGRKLTVEDSPEAPNTKYLIIYESPGESLAPLKAPPPPGA